MPAGVDSGRVPGGHEEAGGIHVRPLVVADAAALAALRGSEVPDGLLAAVTAEDRRAFFVAAINDEEAFGAIAVGPAGAVGYVLIAANPRRIERRMLRARPAVVLRLSGSMIRRGGLRRALTLAGALVRRPTPSTDPEPGLRLLDIVVAASARGTGVGRALVRFGLDEAARRGHGSIGLSVLSTNAAALRLYRAAGFTTSSRGIRSDGEPYEVMRASIAQPARLPVSQSASRP